MPIVVLLPGGGETNKFTTSLTSEDGAELALEETFRLPPAGGCATRDVVFYRPARNLNAGGTYTVSITSSDKRPSSRVTFYVGEHVTVPEADLQPEISYLKVFQGGALCMQDTCPAAYEATLRIDLGESPAQPLWLRMDSGFPYDEGSRGEFYPAESAQVVQTLLLADADDDCIDIRIYGVEGRPLFETRRCQPDRCAVVSVDEIYDGWPGESLDIDQVPEGSCDDPPVLRYDGTKVTYTTPAPAATVAQDCKRAAAAADAGMSTEHCKPAARDSADGCSVARASVARAPAALLVVLVPIALRTLRRRCQRQ